MEICIIAAVADNNAIGFDGGLPWHISEDLKYFKKVTAGCPVIMGRKTYESIGRPLPGRLNIVVSNRSCGPERVCLAGGLKEALSVAAGCADKCFVIGGGQIYMQAMGLADTLYITHVHTDVDNADTFFPAINHKVWKEAGRSGLRADPETGLTFEFVTYKR